MENGYPVVYCRACGNYNYAGARPDGNIAGRHGGRSDVAPYGKSTILYCDMHARAVDKNYVTQPYSSRAESKNGDLWAHFDNID